MSSTFTPTFLYIKQHATTRLLYFGKTIKNPEVYSGSGVHWKRHLAKHGSNLVETIWYCLFLDKLELIKFAVNFSTQQNIVESKIWANQIIENGVDGGSTPGVGNGAFGKKWLKPNFVASPELRALRSENRKRYIAEHGIPKLTDEQRLHKSQQMKEAYASGKRVPLRVTGIDHPRYGTHHTDEWKRAMSERNSGENNPNYGKTTPDEVKQHWVETGRNKGEKNCNFGKLGEAHPAFGKKQSPEQIAARIAFNTGKKRILVKCPFCDVVGGNSLMKRWHFDNCKLKPVEVPLQSDCERLQEAP